MKKLLLLIVLCGCMTVFTACGDSENGSSQQTSPTKQEQTSDSKADESKPYDDKKETADNKLKVSVNGTEFTATLEDNSSAEALTELLKQGDITINMSDYGNFEKVGDLPQSLPTNDESITTAAGDIILYQGNKITIYYAENTWDFTKLGHIDNITQQELKAILGDGDVTVTFSN